MQHLALFGCPRSGTSWLGQIFNSAPEVAYRYQPLFAYEFKDWFGRHGLSEQSLADFHAALLHAASDFVLQALCPAKAARPGHLVWKEVRHHQLMAPLLALGGAGALDHLVYLYRDPVAMLNSWYQAPKEFRSGQDIHHEWALAPAKNTDPSEFNGFVRWKESMVLALQARARWPERVTLVCYEHLVGDPVGQAQALFAQLGMPWGQATQAFLRASCSAHEEDPYSVFRARRAALTLPPDIIAAIRADAQAADLLAAASAVALQSASR